MVWQDRVRQVFIISEFVLVFVKFSVLSQRMVEQVAREKTEKIINAELMKVVNNSELQGYFVSVIQSVFGGLFGVVNGKQMDFGFLDFENFMSLFMLSEQNLDDIQMEVEIVSINYIGMLEYVYFIVLKGGFSQLFFFLKIFVLYNEILGLMNYFNLRNLIKNQSVLVDMRFFDICVILSRNINC